MNKRSSRLQNFLLELGRDLFFVARQKRITIDGDHFYILKVGKLTQQDIGQMLLYTGYFDSQEKRPGEESTHWTYPLYR